MFYLIMTLAAGVCAGFAWRRIKVLSHIGKAVSVTVFVMLFFLGVEIGADRQVLENISELGIRALVLALAGVAGSVLLSMVLYRALFRKETENM